MADAAKDEPVHADGWIAGFGGPGNRLYVNRALTDWRASSIHFLLQHLSCRELPTFGNGAPNMKRIVSVAILSLVFLPAMFAGAQDRPPANDLQMRPAPFTIVTASGRTYRPIAPDTLRRSPESPPWALNFALRSQSATADDGVISVTLPGR